MNLRFADNKLIFDVTTFEYVAIFALSQAKNVRDLAPFRWVRKLLFSVILCCGKATGQ